MNSDWKDALSALRGSFEEPDSSRATLNKEEPSKISPKQKDKLTVVIDKKGRNGKTATIIEGFSIPQKEVEMIAKNLKQKLGVGGSVREGEILIQGEHKKAVCEYLNSMNFKTT